MVSTYMTALISPASSPSRNLLIKMMNKNIDYDLNLMCTTTLTTWLISIIYIYLLLQKFKKKDSTPSYKSNPGTKNLPEPIMVDRRLTTEECLPKHYQQFVQKNSRFPVASDVSGFPENTRNIHKLFSKKKILQQC